MNVKNPSELPISNFLRQIITYDDLHTKEFVKELSSWMRAVQINSIKIFPEFEGKTRTYIDEFGIPHIVLFACITEISECKYKYTMFVYNEGNKSNIEVLAIIK